MRVLFITRTHPHRPLGPLEMRLHDRLRELSELGHDVLVLTKWSGEPIDFDLPARIEVRSPFKTFRPWEWTRALPMVFSWQPELLHVFDPGLSAIERTLSVEMMAMTMMDTLRRASRGRSQYRGGLVSLVGDMEIVEGSWKRAGAEVIESGWLRATGAERAIQPWDFASGRELRFALAGEIGCEVSLQTLIDALEVMRERPGFELTVFLKRTDLSEGDRKRLAQAERSLEIGSNLAVGRRLRLIAPAALQPGFDDFGFDAAIVAGIGIANARVWVERLAMPLVLGENLRSLAGELASRGMGAQVFSTLVSEIAPVAQAFALICDRSRLIQAWSEIEQGALSGGRDVAANHVSRIYSQIARSSATT
ncbi:hypothetical protein BH10BDE1_BH10BDE1_24450 [soil metagenome]